MRAGGTMRTYPSGRTHRGFTLVELMVALSISTVLVLAVHTAFRMGMRLSRREEGREQLETKSRQVVRLLRAELSGAYFPPKQDGKPAPFRFQRLQDTGEWVLAFFTATPAYHPDQPPGFCAQVTYEYRRPEGQAKGTGVLIRREALAAGEELVGEATADVVADGIETMSLNVKRVDQASGGLAEWNPGKLPVLVELRITWASGGSRTAPAGTESLSARVWMPVSAELSSGDETQ
jgi:prepilin-type N-terminal cleavage/methylation domain-containing protein